MTEPRASPPDGRFDPARDALVSSRRKRRNAAANPCVPAAAAPKSSRKTLFYVTASALSVGAVIALFAASVSSNASLTSSARPNHGKALYGQYCVSCHGPSGHGAFNWQYRERAAPALDSSGHAWHHEDEQLVQMILDKPLPDSRMPAWGVILSRKDAIDLVAYIKTLWSPYIRDNCQGAKHMSCMGMR